MSRRRGKSDRREMTVSSDENDLEKFYSKDKYSHRSDTPKKSVKYKKKSDRRELTVSSDENYSEKHFSKEKYSHNSDTQKKMVKHKKKTNKIQQETSSESDGDYDSRKENKTARKHKRKSSKEKYEKQHEQKSDKSRHRNYSEKQEKYRSDKMNKDISPTKDFHKSKKSRKRSKSQEKQRYGKWADEVDGRKEYSSKAKRKDTETDEISNKCPKIDKFEDNYRRDSKYQSSDEDSHRHKRSEYDAGSKLNRKEKSTDKYSNRHEIEEDNGRSFKVRRSAYDDTEDYRKSTKKDREDISQIKHNRNKQKYELEEENCENSYREKNLYSRKKTSLPYVDLDDPNIRNPKRTINETKVIDIDNTENDSKKMDNEEPLSKRVKIGNINMRTGGAYIPPAKLRMMQERIKDKSSEEYQRIAWEALKKSIIGMTNKVNSSNITEIVPDLFKENIIRGRGVLVRAIMQAQGASPTFTRVYAALVSIINTKFPEIGELLLNRLVIQYKRGFKRNDKTICMNATRFLAHLLNQEVAHEVLVLEIVTHLLENPTEDSIEIAICTLKECGKKLSQLTARGMRAITQRVREVLHEGSVDSRVRYMIEVFFAVQKDGFKDFEIIPQELDLVEDEDKYTHLINLDDEIVAEEMLNIFKFDPEYLENEEKYKSVVKEILGDSDEEQSGAESDSEEEGEEDEEKKEENQQIIDMTETNIVCLRRKIYLTIQSSLDFEECAHKLLKLELKPGQILEMCYMILDCCAQQRTYEKFYGLLAQRFCQLNKIYVEPFTEIFENSYKTIHRLETNKLRNVAKFFAHLLYTDAISWDVLSIIKLNEEDTTSSSRIFIKILFQELCEYMGLTKLNERVKDVTLQEAFDGLFPRDHPHNTRFAINFFTSIGLGGLTDELREHLKNLPKNPILPVVTQEKASSASNSSSSSDSSSTSSTSSSDSE